jgi:hypothetical protein
MKWFRTHIRTGSRLALFALVIQFVLTAGHVHIDTAHAAPAGSAIASVQPSGTDPAPAPHRPHADTCGICAVKALASTMLFATPPVLLLPQAAVLLQPITEAEFDHLDAISGASHPRGPPVS